MDYARSGLAAILGCTALLAAQAASAQDAAPPVAVPAPSAPPIAAPTPAAPLANTVRCVFDNLSIEDREITLMLIGLDFLAKGQYARVAPANPIVDRIVTEALPACAQAHRWSAAASNAALAYAHAMLVQEVVRQALEFEARKADPIDAYYVQNRQALAGKGQLDDFMEEGFATHLKAAGWKEADREARRLARIYLEVLIVRDQTEAVFSRALAPRAPAKRPARRARTT
jgi:hypothetical protein